MKIVGENLFIADLIDTGYDDAKNIAVELFTI